MHWHLMSFHVVIFGSDERPNAVSEDCSAKFQKIFRETLWGGIGANYVLLGHVISLGQKKYFDTRTQPQIPIMCILDTRIGLP